MSWLSSWFSSTTVQTSTPVPTAEKRLLDEPAPLPIPVKREAVPTQSQAAHKHEPATTDRPNRSKVIFGAGVAFFAFSLLITRRSFARRRLASNPAFYTNAPGHHAEQAGKVNGAMEAVEALNIATVNVLSLAMMATGGSMWYLDINSMADARKMLRGGLGVDGSGRTEQEAEEEFEEWMASTLARKDAKAARSAMAERGRES